MTDFKPCPFCGQMLDIHDDHCFTVIECLEGCLLIVGPVEQKEALERMAMIEGVKRRREWEEKHGRLET